MTQNKKIIAVTGGIGSGKSTVIAILREWGYPVFSCDEIYGELLQDVRLIQKIETSLGKVTDIGGRFDRKMLSEKVFADSMARKRLEDITHPEIMAELLDRAREADGDKIFCEVPLLFENGFEKYFDDVIIVMRDMESRIEAVKSRSGLTAEEIISRINAQYDYSDPNLKSYKIIANYDNINSLKCTMRDIITKI